MYTNINILILQAQAHCNIVIEDIATILKIKQVALSMKPLPGSPMTGPSHFGVSVLQPQCSMKDWSLGRIAPYINPQKDRKEDSYQNSDESQVYIVLRSST